MQRLPVTGSPDATAGAQTLPNYSTINVSGSADRAGGGGGAAAWRRRAAAASALALALCAMAVVATSSTRADDASSSASPRGDDDIFGGAADADARVGAAPPPRAVGGASDDAASVAFSHAVVRGGADGEGAWRVVAADVVGEYGVGAAAALGRFSDAAEVTARCRLFLLARPSCA